jgi:uncharacterized protein (DUF4415 family)
VRFTLVANSSVVVGLWGSGTRELVSLRLDKGALAIFKATGPGWQGRINDTLKRSAKRLAAK